MAATNKRMLPASLTHSGAAMATKRECFVTDGLNKMHLSDRKQEDEEKMWIPFHNELAARERAATSKTSSRKVSNKDFKLLVTLGMGSFAKVILVKSNFDTGTGDNLFAMKVLDKKLVLEKNQTSHTMTERSVLGRCGTNHPFIVSLKYAFQTDKTLNLVIDFCSGGELFYHLSRVGRFPESRARFYVAELTLALDYLHSYNVVYRDLKPENVLIASDGHIKLADFGLAKEEIRLSTEGTDTFCGTPEYLAPEILYRTGHGKSVDWWSLGILLYEMIYRLPPWYSKNRRKMFEGICSGELVFPQNKDKEDYASQACKSFITGLLTKDAKKRLGSRGGYEVKQHEFFHGISFAAVLRKDLQVPWKPDQGKIYFDQDVTKLPFDVADGGVEQQQQDHANNNSNFNLMSNMIATSPLYPSSFVDRAFSGFSFTDPMHAASSKVASPKKELPEMRKEAMDAKREDDKSNFSAGTNQQQTQQQQLTSNHVDKDENYDGTTSRELEEEEDKDEVLKHQHHEAFYDDGGQFDLELDH